jgi:hypothetical protein
MKFNKFGFILLGSIGLFLLLGVLFSFSKVKNEKHYDDAVSKLTARLRDPDSLIISEAAYDEDSIMIIWNARTGFGGYGDSEVAVYYYKGERENELNIYEQDDTLGGYNLYESFKPNSNDEYFPSWLTEGKINPLNIIGYIFVFLGLVEVGALFVFRHKFFIFQNANNSGIAISSTDKFETEIANKLNNLKKLFDDDLISEEEYNFKKESILNEI